MIIEWWYVLDSEMEIGIDRMEESSKRVMDGGKDDMNYGLKIDWEGNWWSDWDVDWRRYRCVMIDDMII